LLKERPLYKGLSFLFKKLLRGCKRIDLMLLFVLLELFYYFRGDVVMNYQKKEYSRDYRVNILKGGKIIGIEITCCGKHIGEMRFLDGESKICPFCGTLHSIKIQHNHFHIRPTEPAIKNDDKEAGLENAK